METFSHLKTQEKSKQTEMQLIKSQSQLASMSNQAEVKLLARVMAAALAAVGYKPQGKLSEGSFGVVYKCSKAMELFAIKLQYGSMGPDTDLETERKTLKSVHASRPDGPHPGQNHLLEALDDLKMILL